MRQLRQPMSIAICVIGLLQVTAFTAVVVGFGVPNQISESGWFSALASLAILVSILLVLPLLMLIVLSFKTARVPAVVFIFVLAIEIGLVVYYFAEVRPHLVPSS